MLTQLIIARSALDLDQPDLKAHARMRCYTSRRLTQARGAVTRVMTTILSRLT